MKICLVIVFNHRFDLNNLLSILPAGYRIFTVCDHDGTLVEGAHESLGHNSALIP